MAVEEESGNLVLTASSGGVAFVVFLVPAPCINLNNTCDSNGNNDYCFRMDLFCKTKRRCKQTMKQKENPMKTNLIRSSIRIKILLEEQPEALEILESACEQTKFEPSCIYARLYQGTNDVEAVMLEELWEGEEELHRHLQSDTYRRILLAIEMADAPPEIRFDKIMESTGLETIKKARIGGLSNEGN